MLAKLPGGSTLPTRDGPSRMPSPGGFGGGFGGMHFAKGGDVRATCYAQGGEVLGRTRDFMKEPDAFREDKGPGAAQDYAGGKPKGKDKSLKTVTPRS